MLTTVYLDWSGGAQVRGSDAKDVNITAVGLDIKLLCYKLCCFFCFCFLLTQ